MNIKKIEIKNFKSIRDVVIEDIKPIVGLWGKNGVGKSSILQALVVLRAVVLRGSLKDLRDYGIEWSTVGDFIYKNANHINIKIYDEQNRFYEITIPKSGRIISRSNISVDEVYNSIRYFPPWRRIASPQSDIYELPTRDFVNNASNIHSYIHKLVHEKLYEKRNDPHRENELDKINKWAKKFGLGDIFDVYMGAYVKGVYIDPKLKTKVPINQSGYGGNAFLPILLEAYSFSDGILLIEEPELSLHPGAQSEVLEFFIEMTKERGHQIIFTSHSDYILRKIVRKYRDGEITKDFVQLLLVDKNDDGTFIEVLDLDYLKDRFEEGKDLLPHLKMRTR